MGQHQAFCFAFLSCGGHSAQPAHPKTTRWAGWQIPISKGRKVRPGWEMVLLRARVQFPQRGEPLPSLSNHLQLKGGRKTIFQRPICGKEELFLFIAHSLCIWKEEKEGGGEELHPPCSESSRRSGGFSHPIPLLQDAQARVAPPQPAGNLTGPKRNRGVGGGDPSLEGSLILPAPLLSPPVGHFPSSVSPG